MPIKSKYFNNLVAEKRIILEKFLKNLRIFEKLIISYLGIGIVSVTVLTFLFYNSFREALLERTFNQLSSINILKKTQVEDFFISKKKNLEIIASNPLLAEAYLHFLNGKDSLLTPKYVNYITHLRKSHLFKGLALIDTSGNLIYPLTGPISESFRRLIVNHDSPLYLEFLANSQKKVSALDFVGFKDTGETILMLGVPIFSNSNQLLGVIILQKDFNKIEALLYEHTGMGATGESYIVGDDYRMRSRSRFMPDTRPLDIEVNTIAVKEVFTTGNGQEIIEDYRGVPVLSVYRYLDIEGLKWCIVSEMDLEDAMQPVYRLRTRILIVSFSIILAIIIITVLLSSKISWPILRLREVIDKLSKGIINVDVPVPENNDEIGQMTAAVETLAEGLRRTTNFAGKIGAGNFNADFEPLSQEDALGKSLLKMRDALEELRWLEIKAGREKTAALIEGQEQERLRIARELHDGIGQMLNAARMRVAFINGQEDVKADIKSIMDQTINEVRRVSNNLMPGVLLDFGLEAAIVKLCEITAKYSGFKCTVAYNDHDGIGKNINFETAVSVYRIVQEGLNNISKHARATEVKLVIDIYENVATLRLTDNGTGFDYNNKALTGNGLKNMKDRAELLNGKLAVTSAPGQTVIEAEIPILLPHPFHK